MEQIKTTEAVETISAVRAQLPLNYTTLCINHGKGGETFVLYGGKDYEGNLAEAVMEDLENLSNAVDDGEGCLPWDESECVDYAEGELDKADMVLRWAQHMNVGVLVFGYSDENTISD